MTPRKKHSEAQQKTIVVYGNEEAREQQRSAYDRVLKPREVTFVCEGCKQQFTQMRFPGPTPKYHSDDCKREAERGRDRERKQQMRKSKKS